MSLNTEKNCDARKKCGEILSPAGDLESVISSVRAGADAVYLGMKDFSARASAENFDDEMLKNAVSLCHKSGVKVYVAFNIIIKNEEISQAVEQVYLLCRLGVDGVIFQDLAVWRLFHEISSEVNLSCSTQMTLHSRGGIDFAEKLGAKRVVLPRELSKSEIQTLTRCGLGKVETEVFVHGAECMSVSGQCLLSCMIGGRSGNRGRCAGPCRLNFKIGKNSNVLSLKDMSLVENLRELSDMGVASFKIEGRLKGAEYSAAVCDACRKSLDGEDVDIKMLGNVFSRSSGDENPFTNGYYTGRLGKSMYGVRSDDDKKNTKTTVNSVHELYRRDMQRVPIQMTLHGDTLEMTDGENFVSVKCEMSETSVPGSVAGEKLGALGGTVYLPTRIITDDDVYISLKEIKCARREAVEVLDKKRAEIKPRKTKKYTFVSEIQKNRPTRNEKIFRFESVEQIFDCGECKIILPLNEILRNVDKIDRELTIAELPLLVFPDDEAELEENLSSLRKLGIGSVYIQNSGQLLVSKKYGFYVYLAPSLNVSNELSFEEYSRLGADFITESVEVKPFNMEHFGRVVYGKIGVMVFRNCPNRAFEGCSSCDGTFTVTDRLGEKYDCICRNKKFTQMFACNPIYRPEENADFLLFVFTTETRDECRQIVEKFDKNEKINRRTASFFSI